MRKIWIGLLSGSFTLMTGVITLIASSGEDDVNSRLCDFARHYIFGVPEHCPAAESIVRTATDLFVLSLVIFVVDIIWSLFSWWDKKEKRRIKDSEKGQISHLIRGDAASPERGISKACKIIVGTGDPFETVETAGVNRRSFIRVKILNNSNTEISNGRLGIVNLDPPNAGISECEIKSDITLGPNAARFVEIAYYDMGTSQARPGSHISLAVPRGGGFFADAYAFANLPIIEHTFHLRFSRFTDVYDEVFCALALDSNGSLRLTDRGSSTIRFDDLSAAYLEEMRLTRQAREREPLRRAVLRTAEDVRSRMIPTQPLSPDFPIRDLFFILDPDCLGDRGRIAQKLAEEVQDHLSVGRLTAWGREADQGSKLALVEIPRGYWATARLMLNFFGKDTDQDVHVEPKKSGGRLINPEFSQSYRDLRFNRAQVEFAMPDSDRFVPLIKAARRA